MTNITILDIILDWMHTDVFLLSDVSGFGKNLIIFSADMSSSVNLDKKQQDISILGKDPTHELHDTTLTTKKKYAINFSEQHKKFCFGLHCNG